MPMGPLWLPWGGEVSQCPPSSDNYSDCQIDICLSFKEPSLCMAGSILVTDNLTIM